MVEAFSPSSDSEAPARALQFATLQNNEIQITDEAMEFLGSFPCDTKLSIVTIVGPINSGKSSLASKLVGAQQAQDGFQVRSEETQSLEAQKTSTTSGIMIWSKPLKQKDGSQLLVLDMQGLPHPAPPSQSTSSRTSALRSPRGLTALQRGQPTDRLLSFATLISSLMVYTQTGSNMADQVIECFEPIAKFSDQLQRELGAELGASASILSSGSAGNVSARSFGGGSILDITTTVASDLKDIVCQSIICVMKDFSLTEDQTQEGVSLRKAAKKALENAFVPASGVTNETIRKNKTMECLKTIFPHRGAMSISTSTEGKDFARLVSTIKRKATFKAVCGKAVNGNMLLALSLEYAETLSQPVSGTLGLPGSKSSTMHSLIPLFQAFSRVSEEETLRISDTVLGDFEEELNSQVNLETMPLAEKALNKICKKLEAKYKARLRNDLAEIATFDEVMFETDKVDERMRHYFEAKRNENYSQAYYFSVGLLKLLYAEQFNQQQQVDEFEISLSADGLKQKWLNFSNEFKGRMEGDSQAKWDVFAECLIRLPLEQQMRFVDYKKVECEQATDLADETDTMEMPSDGVKSGAPVDLLNNQIQIMSLLETQIEGLKQRFQESLTESQVQAQKVYQNHQELEQAKRDNEVKMDELKRQGDEIVQKRNDMELKVQAVDREREEIEHEFESLSEVTGAEQVKHKAQLEKQGGIAESELVDQGCQVEELKTQHASLDEQVMREEQEMRSEVQLLENEIQASRDEQDQMEQALAQKDKSALIQQVNQFLGHEVPEQYLAQIKEVFGSNSQLTKDLKLKLFEEQRKLNDVDYRYTQEQLQLKQRLDDEFKAGRQKKERELQDTQALYDSTRKRHLELEQKKESINYQLQLAIRTLEEGQEEMIGLNESKDEHQKKIGGDLTKIVACKAKLTEGGENMETLEHQIYELSIQNRNQLAFKEKLIELISEIVKTSQRGKPTPEMVAILHSMPDDRNKHRLESILQPKNGAVN